MSHVCLSIPVWPTVAASSAELSGAKSVEQAEATGTSALLPVLPALLAHAPRVVIGNDRLVWADARGLHAPTIAARLLDVLDAHGIGARAGTAVTPVAASIAARHGSSDGGGRITTVRAGEDRAFIAAFSLDVLDPDPRLANLLDGLGVESCGQLAALSAESVEIRLGHEGMALWKRARADDDRHLFTTPVRSLPSASLEWTEYALRESERLLFVINSLLGSVCDALVGRGERALELALVFTLLDRSHPMYRIRSSRPSGDRIRWLRLLRAELERITLTDLVTGISLRVESVTGNDGAQGDLFDRGFASAGAVEATLAQLADDYGDPAVTPQVSGHPLADRRTEWTALDPSSVVTRAPRAGSGEQSSTPQLTLQLLESPRPIAVVTAARRDVEVPLRYRDDGRWHQLVDVAGPDRVSGGQWEQRGGYAREYFRGVREDGMMVWIYEGGGRREEGGKKEWFLHGWWD